MDYRQRRYYLIDITNDDLGNKFRTMKLIAPSLKMSAPYKHFKNGIDWDYSNFRNQYWCNTTIHSHTVTHLVSVRNEHHYLFRKFLELATKANEIYFICADKRLLGQ